MIDMLRSSHAYMIDMLRSCTCNLQVNFKSWTELVASMVNCQYT